MLTARAILFRLVESTMVAQRLCRKACFLALKKARFAGCIRYVLLWEVKGSLFFFSDRLQDPASPVRTTFYG